MRDVGRPSEVVGRVGASENLLVTTLPELDEVSLAMLRAADDIERLGLGHGPPSMDDPGARCILGSVSRAGGCDRQGGEPPYDDPLVVEAAERVTSVADVSWWADQFWTPSSTDVHVRAVWCWNDNVLWRRDDGAKLAAETLRRAAYGEGVT